MAKKPPDPKYRLRTGYNGHWIIQMGRWQPKNNEYKWKEDSVHPDLGKALRWLFERLIQNNYEADGLPALTLRVEEIYEKLQTLDFTKQVITLD